MKSICMTREIMRNVAVKNSSILSTLDNWKDWVLSNKEWIDQCVKLNDSTADGTPSDYFFSDEYRNIIINQGKNHEGYPDHGKFYNLKPFQIRAKIESYFGKFEQDYLSAYTKLNEEMVYNLGIRRNALCCAYPEDGFVSWHNNANASSYNLIFTYSETGGGYWQHIDPRTKEIVTVPDRPGWQCKGFYFGAYVDDPEHLVYHTARSVEGWRLTISYIFDRHNKDWWLDSIEEIEND